MVNGLRLSLRRYVLWSLFSLAAIVIVLFSIQSSDSFFDGMEGLQKRTMIRAAETAKLEPNGSAQILDFKVYNSYNNLPEEVRASFKLGEFEPNVLLKDVDKPDWLKRPVSARFAILVPLKNGQVRYVAQMFDAPPTKQDKPFRINHIVYSIIIGIVALVSFALALQFLMRSVTKPVEKLQQWAGNLNEKQLDAPVPSFRYKELDALAKIIHNSLQNVRTTLNREREFVNHASHELRTPIAVVSSSVALLHRVIESENIKGNNAVARIEHASKTMADLTETLLWLGRDTKEALPFENINVKSMVEKLSKDLEYLLSGKDVSVTLELEACHLSLPKTASEIIIGNVIRNAYQHTLYGAVDIKLSNKTLIVTNTEDDEFREQQHDVPEQLDGGFGIGLKLIDKLTTKLGWSYQHQALSHGYEVVISFGSSKEVTD